MIGELVGWLLRWVGGWELILRLGESLVMFSSGKVEACGGVRHVPEPWAGGVTEDPEPRSPQGFSLRGVCRLVGWLIRSSVGWVEG